MATKSEIHQARENGTGCGQWTPAPRQTTTVDEVVNLVADATDGHPQVRYAAKDLLSKMARSSWKILGAKHKGGLGGSGPRNEERAADEHSHITITVKGTTYHLRLDSRGHLFRITGSESYETIPVGHAPGAPIPVPPSHQKKS